MTVRHGLVLCLQGRLEHLKYSGVVTSSHKALYKLRVTVKRFIYDTGPSLTKGKFLVHFSGFFSYVILCDWTNYIYQQSDIRFNKS